MAREAPASSAAARPRRNGTPTARIATRRSRAGARHPPDPDALRWQHEDRAQVVITRLLARVDELEIRIAPTRARDAGDMSSIPAELTARRQWVVWRYEKRDGKPTKVPYQACAPTNRGAASGTVRKRPASTTDPSTWRSFQEAAIALRDGPFDGIGYVFSENDPYCGVDFDECVADGETHPARGRSRAHARQLHRALTVRYRPARDRARRTPVKAAEPARRRGAASSRSTTGPGTSPSPATT